MVDERNELSQAIVSLQYVAHLSQTEITTLCAQLDLMLDEGDAEKSELIGQIFQAALDMEREIGDMAVKIGKIVWKEMPPSKA